MTGIRLKTVLLLSVALCTILVPVTAWNDCPYGERDDEYPGICGGYIDVNSEDICDRSQPAPDETTPTDARETAPVTKDISAAPQVSTVPWYAALLCTCGGLFLFRKRRR